MRASHSAAPTATCEKLRTLAAAAQTLTTRLESIAEDLQNIPPSPSPQTGESDPDLVSLASAARHYLAARQQRALALGSDLFFDPCWDMMLDLFASKVEGNQVSVSSACVAANVPPTTALRYLARLEDLRLISRTSDPADGRRCFVSLTDFAHEAIGNWIAMTFSGSAASKDAAGHQYDADGDTGRKSQKS